MIEINLPYLPSGILSPNFLPRTSGGRSLILKERENMAQAVGILVKSQLPVPLPVYQHIRIQYTFIVPDKRARDGDNYIARMKSAQDALVRLGIVPDDSYKYVTVAPPIFIKRGGIRATVIEIEGEGAL